MAEFPRVARLDADLVLGQLADVRGIVLADEGPCPGGQVGAVYVRWPDGHRSVLTWQPAGSPATARKTAEMLDIARAAGIPAPRYELVEAVPSGVMIVQELLPGRTPANTVTRRTVEAMVEVNEQCRGLLTDHGDLRAPSLYLRTSGPGFCLHESLADYDRRTADLLAAIREIGVTTHDHLCGDDLVHFDFHPENVLVDASGAMTGVIDWDAACRGNGDFDLITLRFDLARRTPDLGRWLDGLVRGRVPDDVLRVCWAHMSLRLIDWSIRHFTPADVEAWLDVAEPVLL
ncbi:MAG TPA: aminoglycoside phosphotransferase family protein [Actinoallomurus sp.]|nr:aminoglycoside phosphotransferase family protein [Actinoallomurus sp.]